MIDIDKRFFYLMLSVSEGQKFAKIMDYSLPSVDVQEAETMDVLSRWSLFVNQGILQSMSESAVWVLELLEKTDKLLTPKEELHPLFTAYGLALLNKLLDNNIVSLNIDGELFNE